MLYSKRIDSEVLPNTFKFHTNWVVITGALCAGKTSVINYLNELGYETTEEVARSYLEDPNTDKSIRDDEAQFQQVVTEKNMEFEQSLSSDRQLFLDRGMPDSITYYRVAGIDPIIAAEKCYRFRYKKVFLLERLPIVDDGVRVENDETAIFIQKWLERDYKTLGYEVIFVPIMSIKLRSEFIINELNRNV